MIPLAPHVPAFRAQEVGRVLSRVRRLSHPSHARRRPFVSSKSFTSSRQVITSQYRCFSVDSWPGNIDDKGHNKGIVCFPSALIEENSVPFEVLKAETNKFITMMDPDCDDLELIERRSNTPISEFDHLLRKLATVHENFPNDAMDAATTADRLVRALEKNYDNAFQSALDGTVGISWKLTPNVVLYNFVLHAYAAAGERGQKAAVAAESVLEIMLLRCKKYAKNVCAVKAKPFPPPPPEPSARSFNCVINAWAKCREKESGKRAEHVFRMMEEWDYESQEIDNRNESQDEGNKTSFYYVGVKPSVRSYSGVIDAWANSGTGKSSTDRVSAILDQIIEKRKAAVASDVSGSLDSAVKPNVVVFNSVINAWAKSGSGMYGAEQAEEVLKKMEQLAESAIMGPDRNEDDEDAVGLKPDTRTMTTILEAYASCSSDVNDGIKAVSRAEDILSRMMDMYSMGYDVKPNNVSFNQVITAVGRCMQLKDAPHRAEALLEKLIGLYTSSAGDEALRPSAWTFNSVIAAYGRSNRPDALTQAQRIFDKLEQFDSPDATSYSALITAYAKSDLPGGGRRAINLLDKMEEDENAETTTEVYNAAINAQAKSKLTDVDADAAVSLLARLERAYSSGNKNLKPDNFSYNCTINALSKSRKEDKGTRAREILERMIFKGEDLEITPDAFSFSSTINACASVTYSNPGTKRENLIAAIKTFEDFKQSDYGDPNQFTYGAVLKACSRLASDATERDRLLRDVFYQCCEAGQLNRSGLMWFHRGASRKLKSQVFDGLDQNIGPEGGAIIPTAWTRRAKRIDVPRFTSDYSPQQRRRVYK